MNRVVDVGSAGLGLRPSQWDQEAQLHKVAVVIRSAGERTCDLCKQLLLALVNEQQLTVVSEKPFEKALHRTFEAGVNSKLPWTLAVDADVLVREHAIDNLLLIISSLEANVFEVQGKIIDRLAAGPRPGGLHLYRSSLLESAIPLIPRPGRTKRPEFTTIQRMAAKGCPSVQVDDLVGLHDFGQYLRDIYRKALFHTSKSSWYVESWADMWKRMAETEVDFQAALLGMDAACRHGDSLRADVRQFDRAFIESQLRDHGLEEKPPLLSHDISSAAIGEYIDHFVPEPEYWQSQVSRSQTQAARRPRGMVAWSGFAISALGQRINRLGARLQRRSRK